MEYSEDLIAELLQEWKDKGYAETIIIDHGLLLALDRKEYFPASMAHEDVRINFYDEHLSGSAWSIHAVTLNKTCKGLLVLGDEIYNPWELTQEIRKAFDMPLFSSDNIRIAC